MTEKAVTPDEQEVLHASNALQTLALNALHTTQTGLVAMGVPLPYVALLTLQTVGEMLMQLTGDAEQFNNAMDAAVASIKRNVLSHLPPKEAQ